MCSINPLTYWVTYLRKRGGSTLPVANINRGINLCSLTHVSIYFGMAHQVVNKHYVPCMSCVCSRECSGYGALHVLDACDEHYAGEVWASAEHQRSSSEHATVRLQPDVLRWLPQLHPVKWVEDVHEKAGKFYCLWCSLTGVVQQSVDVFIADSVLLLMPYKLPV